MATTALASSDFRTLSHGPPQDPDIQSTLSDFLTYTEHVPSQLTRSLTLIGNQRIKSERMVKAIHDLSTKYSQLPNLDGEHRPDPVRLRKSISHALEEAERASRMALEEAARMHEMCGREASRLNTVTNKLKAQPKPPSRDPTPEQSALTSPNLKREGRLGTAEIGQPDRTPRRRHPKAESKLRGRKIMVPGEVLPPPDPNTALDVLSDWSSPRASPTYEPALEPQHKATPRPRSRTPKIPKSERRDRDRKQRISRGPGQPGTNAHSAVAGISTSNALLALTPPPEDAVKGSKWLPWLKLTEWEMAKLRKRMKKNAIWVPSTTMVRRELKNLGRGVAGKEAARNAAENGGPTFVDEGNEPDPTKIWMSGQENTEVNALLAVEYGVEEGSGAQGDDDDEELINRGMRLNEAKKLKRQRMLEEQALQQQLAREQGIELPSTTSDIKNPERKRKRDGTPGNPEEGDKPVQKKLKIAPPSILSTGNSKVPLAPTGPSSSPRSNAARAASRKAATPPPSTINRKPTITLKTMKAVSEEPPSRRASQRRNSNASLPGNGALASPALKTSSGRNRSRRPAPGVLTGGDDESAKSSISKRKAAPRKKASASAGHPKTPTTTTAPSLPQIQELAGEEYVDPNEARYCDCGDVSWGTMIGCDNDDCEKEWFHLSCVGLDDLPPRRTEWYCPDCRKKLKLGEKTNGIVGGRKLVAGSEK